MAYGEVTLTSMPGGVEGRQYENPDKIPKPGASTYEPSHSSNPEAPEYASTEDIVGTIHWLLSLDTSVHDQQSKQHSINQPLYMYIDDRESVYYNYYNTSTELLLL